MITFGMQHKIQ